MSLRMKSAGKMIKPMKKNKYCALGAMLFLASLRIYGQGEIVCVTPREYHRLIIRKTSVSVIIPKLRSVASEVRARTKFIGNGLTKIVYLDGKKFTVHIEDQNNFSESKDYLVIKSQDQHEITYPLSCSRK